MDASLADCMVGLDLGPFRKDVFNYFDVFRTSCFAAAVMTSSVFRDINAGHFVECQQTVARNT